MTAADADLTRQHARRPLDRPHHVVDPAANTALSVAQAVLDEIAKERAVPGRTGEDTG